MKTNRTEQPDSLIRWILSGLFACFYFELRTSCHTFDSIEYVSLARNLPFAAQFHPHHLGYHLILFAIAKIESLFGYHGLNTLWLYILPSCLFGGVAVGAVYRLCRLLTAEVNPISSASNSIDDGSGGHGGYHGGLSSKTLSLIAAIGTGVSFSMISMSTDIEKYPIAVFFIFQSLISIVKNRHLKSPSRLIRPAIWLTIAVLMHQTAVLTAPLMALFLCKSAKAGRFRYHDALIFMFSCFILAGFSYGGVAFYLGHRTPASIWQWVTSYVQNGSWGHGLSDPVCHWITGNMSALIGPDLFSICLPGNGFGIAVFSILFGILLIATWIWALIAAWRNRSDGRTPVRLFLLAWIVCFAAFIVWWEPLNAKVATLYVPAVWIFFCIQSVSGQHNRGFSQSTGLWLMASLVLVAAPVNLARAYRLHPPAANIERTVAEAIAGVTEKQDVILLPYQLNIDRYLAYFLDRPNAFTLRSLVYSSRSPADLKKTVDDAMRAMCGKEIRLVFTQAACQPEGKDLSGAIRHADIRVIVGNFVLSADRVCDLPNGDVLMRLRNNEYCQQHFREAAD